MTDKELFTMVLESLERLNRTGDTQVFDMFDAPVLIPALCARLAQPEQKPGMWTPVEIGIDVTSAGTHVVGMYVLMPEAVRHVFYSQFHPALPQREWVGLTDDELHALHFELKVQTMGGINTLGMYRILEAKLKDKNNG